MKKIICYGDSNTFGYNPKDECKYTVRKTELRVLLNTDNIG